MMIICGKGEKELKGIPICFDGMLTAAFNAWKVLIKKLMNTGRQLHRVPFEVTK
jgi:hypothetical protein